MIIDFLSQSLLSLIQALLGLGPFLLQRLDRYCRERSKRARLYFLSKILELNLDPTAFDVLYKGKQNRKPKDPCLLFGILIAKEVLNLSDQGILDEIRGSAELQELFHIKEEDVPCRKTLSRFRNKLNRHFCKTGENLVEKVINSLIQAVQFYQPLYNEYVMFRIDSTQIEAFLRECNRMGLFYLTLKAFVNSLDKKDYPIPDALKHYTNKGEYNEWFYRKTDEQAKAVYWNILLGDIQTIVQMEEKYFQESIYYPILLRLVDEQTYLDEHGQCQLKDTKEIPSNSLQSPFDTDATYRYKDGPHVGYVVNFVEEVVLDEEGKIVARNIVYYQLEQNIYSDSQFLKDFLQAYPMPETMQILVCDGVYYSYENSILAGKRNFTFVPTDLVGRKPDPFLAGFELTDNGTAFGHCPGGKTPTRVAYREKTSEISLTFKIEDCRSCPHKKICKPKFHVRVANKTISQKQIDRARILEAMDSEAYQKLAHLRNGVESIPSQLKNVYHINKIRTRGLFNTSMLSGFKIFALTLSKLTDTWIRVDYPRVSLVE